MCLNHEICCLNAIVTATVSAAVPSGWSMCPVWPKRLVCQLKLACSYVQDQRKDGEIGEPSWAPESSSERGSTSLMVSSSLIWLILIMMLYTTVWVGLMCVAESVLPSSLSFYISQKPRRSCVLLELCKGKALKVVHVIVLLSNLGLAPIIVDNAHADNLKSCW